jgi:hypothetical protein
MLPKDTRVGTLDHSVLQEVVLAQASKPSEKRRGSWSFLTWSFFLAQTLAAEKFFGSGARAGENDDAGATRSNDQSKIPSDETASAAAWGPGGQDAGDGRTIDGQTPLNGAQGLLLPGVSQAVSDYSGAGSAGSPNGSGSDGSGGGGGSSSDLGQPLSSLADSEALGDSSAIPPGSEIPTNAPNDIIPPPDVIDAGIDIGPDLDTDLDLELNLDPVADAGLGLELGLGDGADLGLDLGLGSPLADGLALETEVSLDVNLLGGDPSLDLGIGVGATSPLLSASIDQVSQGAIPGEFVTSVISNTTTELEPLQQVGAVSSGDVIAFSGGATSNLTDDLFTGGRYTDYGLALHTNSSPGVGSVTNSLDSDIVDEGPSSLLDKSDADGASTQSRSSVEDNLDTSHLGLPSSVDELARTDAI